MYIKQNQIINTKICITPLFRYLVRCRSRCLFIIYLLSLCSVFFDRIYILFYFTILHIALNSIFLFLILQCILQNYDSLIFGTVKVCFMFHSLIQCFQNFHSFKFVYRNNFFLYYNVYD